MGADISATVARCQQRRFWLVSAPRISVPDMETKITEHKRRNYHRRAKPTEADLVAAGRLRKLWDQAVKRSKEDPESPRLTQETAAAELEINQSAVSQYLNGLIPLNYRALLVFSRLVGVRPEDIRNDLPEQALGNRIGEEQAEYGEWDDVMAYSQAVSLGDGSEPTEYAETHKLKFKASSLSRKGLRARHLRVFYANGDSMLPRISSGDALLFDTSDTKPRDGAIFVIQIGTEISAKRCEIIDDTIFFRSDNPAGDHNWRKPKRLDNPKAPITILGRVRWIGSWEH